MAQPVVTRNADSIFAWKVCQGDYEERFPDHRDAISFAKDATVRGWDEAVDAFFGGWDEGPSCGICDGLGHGFPGGGPCPLEDRGWDDGPGHAWER